MAPSSDRPVGFDDLQRRSDPVERVTHALVLDVEAVSASDSAMCVEDAFAASSESILTPAARV